MTTKDIVNLGRIVLYVWNTGIKLYDDALREHPDLASKEAGQIIWIMVRTRIDRLILG